MSRKALSCNPGQVVTACGVNARACDNDAHIWMHRLCNVVRHYIQVVCSNLKKKLFFVIDFTRRKVVKMRTKVLGV